jgi:hypothetical protein
MIHSVRCLGWTVLLCALSVPAAAQPIALLAPGAALPSSPHSLVAQRWHALTLRDDVLIIAPVTRRADAQWHAATGQRADRLLAGRALKVAPATALALPPGALFAVRSVDGDGTGQALPLGRFPSSVAAATLDAGWRASATIHGQRWTMSTRVGQQTDGQPLAGSLSIIGRQADGAEQVLLAPAAGMAFARQELLWLGDLDADGQPDLLLKRTLLTGELEYMLALGPDWGTLAIDVDRAARYSAYGVDPENNRFTWRADEAPPGPFKLVRRGGFTISDEAWQAHMPADTAALPKTMAEHAYTLQGERIRFSLEYLPRATEPDPGSANPEAVWKGKVLVKAHFRGQTQVLMEAAPPDGDGFTLSFGTAGGRPAIVVQYHPHYNNSFEYYWIHRGARFRKVLIKHAQGC